MDDDELAIALDYLDRAKKLFQEINNVKYALSPHPVGRPSGLCLLSQTPPDKGHAPYALRGINTI